jgi:PD-(D/E)XK endonuclease
MAKCEGFKNFKERGEWVEAQFIAQALRKGFRVLKPWGDSSAYDVCVEHGRQFFRMQVKSTSFRVGNGYLCAFTPNRRGARYTTRSVDFFAACVIPEDAWYILPARVVLKTKSHMLMLCPGRPAKRSDGNLYEIYLEAWPLLRTKRI